MNEAQKKLRRWFQRHGWHTGNTPTGQGFYLESPVENCAGSIHRALDTKTGQVREYCWEAFAGIELDRFCCDYISLSIYERKHWWKRDLSVSADDHTGYTWIPSDDFEPWPRQATASISIPAHDIIKLAELIQAAKADWMAVRKTKNHLNFMERIAKSCGIRWIGVNSSYEEIKWTYSNERLRQEAGEVHREN